LACTFDITIVQTNESSPGYVGAAGSIYFVAIYFSNAAAAASATA
jgi:hypothetical protein